jgi:hypothetical protein
MIDTEIDWAEPITLMGRKSGRFISEHRYFFITWFFMSILFAPVSYGCLFLYREYGAEALIFPILLFAFIITAVFLQYMNDEYY